MMMEFRTNQQVRCIDAKMEGCGPALDEGRIYTVRKFTPASQCEPHPVNWQDNGGRIELMELPGGSGAGFYGNRFEAAQPEPSHCIWQSSKHYDLLKLWNTACGGVFEGLREICPTCGKRVMLVGFDAWWEARKSYHP